MTILAEKTLRPPTFLDDLTPDSGLALRRWTPDEYRRMASPAVFGPDERLDLVEGEIVLRGAGGPRLFSREEYYRLAKRGILAPDERTELIYGRIIKRMSPMGRPHSVAVGKTAAALETAFGDRFVVEDQVSIQLGSGLEPFPDVMVMPGTFDDYPDVPLASDVLLLVEVSDTTLRYDWGTKAAMYAADSIPDYWLINLRARTLEVRRQPESGEYLSLGVYAEGESVAPLAAPDAPVRVADLLLLTR
jgi:Uma2 family endonuclease